MSAALRLAQLQKDAGRRAAGDRRARQGARAGRARALRRRARSVARSRISSRISRRRARRSRAPVHHDDVYFLTERGKLRFPITPPPLTNHGNYIISLNKFVKWLARQVEAAGVDIFSGFAASEVLYDGDRVIGVRTGDRGLDKHGGRKPTFEPGVDIHAKVTIFCDGVRGNLTKTLVNDAEARRGPACRSSTRSASRNCGRSRRIGCAAGHRHPHDGLSAADGGVRRRLHLRDAGRPAVASASCRASTTRIRCSIRIIAFQRFKQHPFVASLLEGGKMVRYGAKALPEGGWHTIPRVHMDGALIAGDAGGFMNSMRLKGIHLAMRTGMLAAETAFDAVRAGDVSATRLATLPGRRSTRATSSASCIRCATSTRRSSTDSLAGRAVSRACRW